MKEAYVMAADLENTPGAAGEDVFIFPVSFAQQRLWFLDRLVPGNPLHNVFVAVHLRGRLHVAALQQTLHAIVRRHESLRTTFAMLEGQPVQVIAPTRWLAFPEIDLHGMPAGQRQAQAQRLARAELQRPFDLEQGPLMRATLLWLGEGEYVALLTMHHIISDGWSMEVFIQEVAAIYAAFVQGASSPLPDLTIQYADFAHWQRQWLQGAVLEAQLAYWQQQLANAPPVLQLPTDHPRPALLTSQGSRQSCCFPDALSEQIKALGRAAGMTPFMVFLAAFTIMLRYVTGGDDIVVGTDVANRNRAETEGLIGFFVNQLVLRSDLSGNPTFRELLERVCKMTLAAYDHQDLPFEMLVAALQPQRSLRHAPLFQVKLVLQTPPMGSVELPELRLSALEVGRETAGFDVLLYLWAMPGGFRGWLEYSTELFEAATIARLAAHLTTVLHRGVTQPDTRLSVFDAILTAADRQQRSTQRLERQALNLHELTHSRRQAIGLSSHGNEAGR
jgi:hypothetical protein